MKLTIDSVLEGGIVLTGQHVYYFLRPEEIIYQPDKLTVLATEASRFEWDGEYIDEEQVAALQDDGQEVGMLVFTFYDEHLVAVSFGQAVIWEREK